jgi:hypothetical protein
VLTFRSVSARVSAGIPFPLSGTSTQISSRRIRIRRFCFLSERRLKKIKINQHDEKDLLKKC